MKPRRDVYHWRVLEWVDNVTSVLTVPFLHTLSLALSCYCPTTHDSKSRRLLAFRFLLLGPLLLAVTVALTPLAAVGYVVWVGLCTACARQPFTYEADPATPPPQQCPAKVTFVTANVILIPEVFVRFNNCKNVYWRVHEIGKRLLLHQNPALNAVRNLQEPVEREDIIQSRLPELDVLLLQEVLERWRGRQLYNHLKSKYPYCIYDAGRHTFGRNLCLIGSGLFIASKFPVIDASFHPFSYSTWYAKFVGYGVLIAKLHLGPKDTFGQVQAAVGYVGNVHTQAYQGKDPVIVRQLEEARQRMNEFILRTLHPQEFMAFAVLGGDFNSDNMSPSDRAVQVSPVWEQYRDPCRVYAGQDKHWVIGTEHRQKMLHHPLIKYPETFRDVLADEVQRRHFIIDADVKEQTLDLMNCCPEPDEKGIVQPTLTGGRRRIDYLTVRGDSNYSPTSMWFSSALAGLTDHLPVAMMLEDL